MGSEGRKIEDRQEVLYTDSVLENPSFDANHINIFKKGVRELAQNLSCAETPGEVTIPTDIGLIEKRVRTSASASNPSEKRKINTLNHNQNKREQELLAATVTRRDASLLACKEWIVSE